MSPTGLEPTVSASERPPICDIDRAATGVGKEEDLKESN